MIGRKLPEDHMAERNAKIVALRASGISVVQICQRFGLGREAVGKIVRAAKEQAA